MELKTKFLSNNDKNAHYKSCKLIVCNLFVINLNQFNLIQCLSSHLTKKNLLNKA